ncbi:MAG: type IV pilin protein [Planctomycetota bacterium]
MSSKPKKCKWEMGFTLIELITLIIVLGVIGSVAISQYLDLTDKVGTSAVRAVGGTLSSSIAVKHDDYLIRGNDYTATDVINDTLLEGGISTPTVAGNLVTLISGTKTYTWNYTPRSGVDTAYLTENISSAFP